MKNSAQNTGIFHSKWNYDNDLFPISTKDFIAHKGKDPTLSSNSLFKYDTQDRLISAKGIGDDTSS
ncbi:hypothetical protein GCL60_04075 [Silvanigrella paludirubra]|uniref:Uncharacterized protein n=1 Tax=Silvanigrella paludirubra TaxID=2499159 RepID=A0A6N6VYL2_9BACT|nr:hypothetical protein [Silvanigrella paludirubra]KAB8039438.1 hypothetical protein GCL60_04075 [Silvanigrella paludirubra]